MTDARPELFISWARYLYWSDILYQRWTGYQEDQGDAGGPAAEWRGMGLSAQWLASVPVLIEGWQQLNASDHVIDSLLSSYPDYCALLRRFRNGVHHFQPQVFDDRLCAFPERGQETLLWVVALFYEFKRFLWEWPDKHMGTPDEKEELRSEVERAVGWLPWDTLQAREHQVREQHREAERLLAEADDDSSPETMALRAAIAETENQTVGIDTSPLLRALTRLNRRS